MGSKVAKVLAMVAVLVALAVTAVAAQSATSTAVVSRPSPTIAKQCYSKPCDGNSDREVIYERIGDRKQDLIRAYGNYDDIHANTYSKDSDQAYGFGGNDFIYVNDGDTLDNAGGGRGYDTCYVDAKIEAGPAIPINACERVIVR
jgi:opacity protein-like surface antigen